MSKKELSFLQQCELGVQLGTRVALSEHKRNGRPIFVWRDGKVVEIPPEKIILPAVPGLSEAEIEYKVRESIRYLESIGEKVV